jgi:hypothetical protein
MVLSDEGLMIIISVFNPLTVSTPTPVICFYYFYSLGTHGAALAGGK